MGREAGQGLELAERPQGLPAKVASAIVEMRHGVSPLFLAEYLAVNADPLALGMQMR